MLDVIKQNRLRKRLGVGPYSGAPSVRQKPINGSVFRWGAGPSLDGDSIACENNFYSTHMPIKECRVSNNIYEIAKPFCIESQRIDGNDVLKVYKAAKKAVEKCRNGKGPVFLEFVTYRIRGHVGADDNIQGAHTDIRPKEEIEKWQRKDPIKKFGQFLVKNGMMTERALREIDQQAEAEVNEAHIFARTSPYPRKRELTKYVFK